MPSHAMNLVRLLVLASLLLLSAYAGAAESSGQACSQQLRRALAALRDAAARDGSALWGHSIDGPFVLVDPDSRATETLIEAGPAPRCRTGTLPPELPIANTCLSLGGESVASLILPLPRDEKELARLLTHERWHCLQKRLGLDAQGDDNTHLGDPKARILLRLELRALRDALMGGERAWRWAAKDAIAFRALRSASGVLGSDVLGEEAKLERNEGLAEYTGQRLSEPDGDVSRLVERLRNADAKESFLRSFAYETGPAYGLLLDRCSPGWQHRFRQEDDLPSVLSACISKRRPSFNRIRLEELGERYGYQDILVDEQRREAARLERSARNTALFVTGRYLQLPLEQPNIQFDPNNLFVLPGIGTVYQGLVLNDVWGSISVKGEALVDKDWRFVRVPLVAERCELREEEASLSLTRTYALVADSAGRCALSER